MNRVRANGVDYAYLSDGEGPLVVLIHGFPDTAHTWDETRPALAKAGYRAVAPFIRGYHPSGIAPDGRYGGGPLGEDILALIEALGEKSAVVVGHDWGAFGAYAATSLDEARVRLLVTLAIPHPLAIPRTLPVLWRGRHFVRFKLPGAVAALRKNDFALVDELLHRWSSAWNVPPGESRAAKECFSHPESAAAAIEYYRQTALTIPAALQKKISVPTVCFAGETDGALLDLSIYDRARSRFTGPYEVVRMPGGHFLHREHPERFNSALIDAIGRFAPGK